MGKITKLCIDPGHGNLNTGKGYDTGATSAGFTEAGIVLDWCLTLKYYAVLAGITVFMTRDDATDPDYVGTRDNRANEAGCSHFISLHLNESDAASATGSECYYRDAKDKELGQVVHHAVVNTMATKDRGMKSEGESQHTRLAIFDFDGPACLEEIGFISSSRDRAMLCNREYRILACRSIVAGLIAKFGV